MAEVLASLKKIGGNGEQYTETVLWTNPAPTAQFAGQAVTLSDSLSNYKYIGIRFAYGTSYKTGEYISTLLETVADFRKFGYSTGVRRNGSAICISDANNKSYERLCIYISDTSVHFNPCYQVASSTQANGNAIPLEILGINELAHGKSAGPMFEIEVGGGGSTTSYSYNIVSNDSSLVTPISVLNQSSGTLTVNRNASGRIYFNSVARGTRTSDPSFTVNGVSYNPNDYKDSAQSGISVSLTTDSAIRFKAGKSANFDVATLTFVEDA